MNRYCKKIKKRLTPVKDLLKTGADYLRLDTADGTIGTAAMQKILMSAGVGVKHPFILADARDFERVAEEYAHGRCDETVARSLDYLLGYCNSLLDTSVNPPLTYTLENGDGLLEVSRTVLQRVCALSGMFRITNDEKYAERAVSELMSVCAFPDWHSSHFLDCAEMAFAVSLGCDWLWDYLTKDQKELFCEKTWEYAIEPAFSPDKLKNWWTWSKTNWNNVCYSALGTACMMFYKKSPEKAARLLASAVKFMPAHSCVFTPDGVYAEGSGYWEYGTAYLVYFIKNTRAFFGTDFGLSECPGFSKTGYFPLYITLPTGVFNFGDNKEIPCASPILYFFAKEYNSSALAEFENKYTYNDLEDSARDSMLTALWYSPALLEGRSEALPLAVHLRSDLSQELVIMRSSYSDKNAASAAVKAGGNGVNHADLDIGSFVLDCDGIRWVCDLGAGNYAAPGYFNNLPAGGRWKNYCKRAEGHNTIVISRGKNAGDGQYAFARCRFSSFEAYSGGAGKAVLDMTDAYRVFGAERVVSTYEMTEDFSQFIISDRIECDEPGDIYRFMHTRAEIRVKPSGREAVLTADGKSMTVRLSAESDGIMSVSDPVGLDGTKKTYDRDFPGIRKLCISATDTVSANFTVVFLLKG